MYKSYSLEAVLYGVLCKGVFLSKLCITMTLIDTDLFCL